MNPGLITGIVKSMKKHHQLISTLSVKNMDYWTLLKQEQTATDDVIKDLRSREKMGYKKYNKFLTPNTDEDMLNHLYNELLDAGLYLRTLINQRGTKYDPTL